jgi:hypothetical protein
MINQIKALELRKLALITQSNRERNELRYHLKALKRPISWIDKGLDAFLFLKNNPLLWTSAFSVLLYYKPKLSIKLLLSGQSVISLLKSARKLI